MFGIWDRFQRRRIKWEIQRHSSAGMRLTEAHLGSGHRQYGTKIPYQWSSNDSILELPPVAIENLRIAEKMASTGGGCSKTVIKPWLRLSPTAMAESNPEWEAHADEVIGLLGRVVGPQLIYTITGLERR